VAFQSWASNLVSGDGNEVPDIFVQDRDTQETTRVSVVTDGTEAGDWSAGRQSISADGRYVAFQSGAWNLVRGTDNGYADIYVHDRLTGQTTRVSVASDGTEGNEESLDPSLSADGRFVAFTSWASNLVDGDTNEWADIFVHDRTTGQTSRVSIAFDASQGDHMSEWPSFAASGGWVAFASEAGNLVSDDTNGEVDIFIRPWVSEPVPTHTATPPTTPSATPTATCTPRPTVGQQYLPLLLRT
jgi:Tol biopolymer transport system component